MESKNDLDVIMEDDDDDHNSAGDSNSGNHEFPNRKPGGSKDLHKNEPVLNNDLLNNRAGGSNDPTNKENGFHDDVPIKGPQQAPPPIFVSEEPAETDANVPQKDSW